MTKHLERVHSLPCVVCKTMLGIETFPVHAHHLESIRDSHSDYAAVPLCELHHTGSNGVHGLSRAGFERKYKLTPIDLLALTIRAMEREGMLK